MEPTHPQDREGEEAQRAVSLGKGRKAYHTIAIMAEPATFVARN